MATKKELVVALKLSGMTKEEVIQYFQKLIKRRDNKNERLLRRAHQAEHQASFLNHQILKQENIDLRGEIDRLGEGSLQLENKHLVECNRKLSDQINILNSIISHSK